MAGYQHSIAYVPATCVTSSPAAATGYAKERITDREFPLKYCRSTVTTLWYLVLDFGSALANASYQVCIFGGNFTSIKLAHGDSATATDGSYTAETSHTLVQDGDTTRYKGIFTKTLGKRYMRIGVQAQTPTDGAAFFFIGHVCVLSAVTTLTHNPDPFERIIERRYYGSGQALQPRSDFFVAFAWKGAILTTELAEWQALMTYGDHTTFVLFENMGDVSKVYLMRTRGGGRRYQRGPQSDITLPLLVEYIGPYFES